MNRKANLLLSLFTALFFTAYSQAPKELAAPKYAIKGKLVKSGTSNPVEFATVSIFNEVDSALITGGLTDVDGVFNVPVEPGDYYIRIQFMGFKDVMISNVNISKSAPVYDAGQIPFAENETLLEEVVVQAERTQMEMTLDKKVFNIGKDLSNLGGSATDILDNLPSVQVDVDGNVNLRGSGNVRILIDGKPSGLVGLSSNDALRQLNGNLVESIEIITNPSARYDAEGLAGIINIVLKKDKKKGLNGSFQVNTGIPDNHGGSINLNVRKNWINFFTNFGINYRRNDGRGFSDQVFFDSPDKLTPTLETIRDRTQDRGGLSYSTRFGSDIYLNETNTLTLAFLYRYSDENNKTRLIYDDFYPQSGADSISFRNDDEGEGDENIEYSLNYTRDFERKGQKLTFDFQYQNNNEAESSDLIETIGTDRNDQIPILLQRANNDEIEERFMLQSDYIHPFGKDGKLEFGTRYTDRLVGNDYVVTEQNNAGIYEVDSAFSNEFEYEEDVLAVYAIVGNKIDKLSWQVGLRFEQTRLLTFQKTDDNRNVQNYGNFFPSVFFTYQFTKEQAIQTSYSRRISRPRGRSLNPFTSISDSRNFWLGNPGLQPEYTDSYELGYLLNTRSGSLYTGVYYRHTEGGVQRLRNTTEEGITFTRPYNVSTEDAYGVEVNISQDFTDWYRVSGNVNFYRSIVPDGSVVFGESTLSFNGAEATTLSSRLSNNFKFNKLFDAQLNVNYRAPRNTVQGKTLSITSVDLGMSRDILKGNGTLAFNIRDLFNSRKYRSEISNERSFQYSEYQRRTTTATLSFTYRLNQKKQRERGGDGDYDGDGGGEF
ncbi:TonB-dependent receptor domain-containing protein [Ekhidna sp.]|uniref:TonB-dependent receptor domain-containing protein n=1 Tax=Ekhidna sp. TaxID=2608089 RepID=UPI003BA8C6B6